MDELIRKNRDLSAILHISRLLTRFIPNIGTDPKFLNGPVSDPAKAVSPFCVFRSDEIGELPLNLQIKRLRGLQERKIERIGSSASVPINVRVIAATNRDFVEKIRKGDFREDLYWRLNVVPVNLPPLQSRAEDIPLLLDFYISRVHSHFPDFKKILLFDAIKMICLISTIDQ